MSFFFIWLLISAPAIGYEIVKDTNKQIEQLEDEQ